MNTAIIKPQWGPLTIALMVLGFVVFWPLGLAVLAYILWGEMFGGSVRQGRAVHEQRRAIGPKTTAAGNLASAMAASISRAAMPHSTNIVPSSSAGSKRSASASTRRSTRSTSICANLRMARDREEFDRFMRDRQRQSPDL